MNNEITIENNQKCTGCEACKSVCPMGAIDMKISDNHFSYPVIDKEKCNECGLCNDICPTILKPKSSTHNIGVYEGYFADDNKRVTSASGGLATALGEKIIDSNGVVFGVSYSDDFKKAEHIEIKDKKELERLKGSKYFESDKNNCFQNVKKHLNNGTTVLYIGLPCDIAGLKAYLRKEYDNLYCCELICHGVTSQDVHKKYIEYMEGKFNEKVLLFNTRYQRIEDDSQSLRVLFKNGKEFKRPMHHSLYGEFFYHFDRPSCYNCTFKGDYRQADLSIGDSWCEEENSLYGKSIAYVHNLKGEKLMQSIDGFRIRELDFSTVKNDNPSINNSLPVTKRSLKMKKYYDGKHLKWTVFRSKNLTGKIKFCLRNIFYLIK